MNPRDDQAEADDALLADLVTGARSLHEPALARLRADAGFQRRLAELTAVHAELTALGDPARAAAATEPGDTAAGGTAGEAAAEAAMWRAMRGAAAAPRRRLSPSLAIAAAALLSLLLVFWPRAEADDHLAGAFPVRVVAAEPLRFRFEFALGDGGAFRVVIEPTTGPALPPIVVRDREWSPDAPARAAMGDAARLRIEALDYQQETVATATFAWRR